MIHEALTKIKVLGMDMDGVLTDGRIIIDSNGVETKNFDVQDGFGIVFWQKCGLKTAVISARPSEAALHRVKDLKIDKVYVGVYPKAGAYESMLKELKVKDEEVCFMGDDVADIGVMRRCGLSVAVANAVFEVKQIAHYITAKPGGRGAVREVVEMILKAQGHWEPKLYAQ